MYMTANGQWGKAAELLRALNKELPNVAPLFFLRAQVETQLGNSDEAIIALQRGIKLVDSSAALGWLSKEDFNELRTSEAFKTLEAVDRKK
jgi:tetratricopeptide (TPR) repeat protein